jgi:hypothetical protein
MLVMIVRLVGYTHSRERQHGSLVIGLKEICDVRHDSLAGCSAESSTQYGHSYIPCLDIPDT